MRKISVCCLAAGAFVLAAGQASATPSPQDQTFAQKAASGGMAEVQTAQLAQQRAASPQVKEFASRMIQDHTQANSELQQVAQQAGITLPSQADQKEMATQQRLRGLNGASFDQAYAQDEVRDHQEDVALFKKEASSGQDPTMKAFAQKTLPILQQHLQMAQSLPSAQR
jgi:putative membrane protein